MTNLKTCSTNSKYDVTPCDSNQCTGQCVTWYSFYGEIEVQEDLWINSVKKGGLGQLLPNNTYIYYYYYYHHVYSGGTFFSAIGPIDLPGCTGNNKCPYIDSPPWDYISDVSDIYISPSGVIGVIFIILGVITILIVLALIVKVARRIRYWDIACLPYINMGYLILSILFFLNGLFYIGKPTTGLCRTFTFFHTLVLYLMIMIPVQAYQEECNRIKRLEYTKDFYRIELCFLLVLVFLISVFNIISSPIKSISYLDEVHEPNPIWYYYCENFNQIYVTICELVYILFYDIL